MREKRSRHPIGGRLSMGFQGESENLALGHGVSGAAGTLP